MAGYPYEGIAGRSSERKKKLTYDNVDESQHKYAERKKPDPQTVHT